MNYRRNCLGISPSLSGHAGEGSGERCCHGEKRGRDEKQCDPHDRRRVNARLTQAGAEACERLRGELEGLTGRYLSCLEPDELDAFVRALQKLGAQGMDFDGVPAPTDFLELD